MSIFAIINLIATMGPSILSLISQVEQLFPTAGSGEAKKSVVLETVHNAAVSAGHTAQEVATIIPVASAFVDTMVSVLNTHDAWKPAANVADSIHGGLNLAAQAAKQIQSVAVEVEKIASQPYTPPSVGD